MYNSGANNNLIMYLYDASGKSDYSGAQLKNNLFIVPSGINNYRQIMNVGTTGSNVQISNNLVARIGTYGTVTGFSDQNGINGGDPEFVNEGAQDYHLQSDSPAINKGATLATVTDDRDSTPRPQATAWDIGAYEFSSGANSKPLPPTGLTVVVR